VQSQRIWNTAEALAGLREAIGAGDRQPEEFVFLGQLEFEAGDYENAAATFAKLAAMDPGHGTAAFNRAVCLEKLSRWSEAAAAFREAADDGDLPAAWLGLGLCLLHQRRPEDALAAFERFLIVEPDHESALFGQAVALQMLRRFDEAQRYTEDSRPVLAGRQNS
jgi:tetratricopeptide (TPR) repeat protein